MHGWRDQIPVCHTFKKNDVSGIATGQGSMRSALIFSVLILRSVQILRSVSAAGGLESGRICFNKNSFS